MCMSQEVTFFFFNDTATTEIYTLSLHDALPILAGAEHVGAQVARGVGLLHRGHQPPVGVHRLATHVDDGEGAADRSEEHTSELQSRQYLVCRLLLEKKNIAHTHSTSDQSIDYLY